MTKDVAERCVGAQRINDRAKGRGDTLEFPRVPDSMSGAFLNDIAGLDASYNHPLKGAVYLTENNPDKTFSVTIFQNEVPDLAKAFIEWFMAHNYVMYADDDTKKKLIAVKL